MLGRIVTSILNRHHATAYRVGKEREENGGRKDHSGLGKIRQGVTRKSSYLNLNRDLGLLGEVTPAERLMLTLGNFFGVIEDDSEDMIVWMLYALARDEERETWVAEAARQSGFNLDDVRSRVPERRRREILDPMLVVFAGLAREGVSTRADDQQATGEVRRRNTTHQRQISETLRALRRYLLRAFVAEVRFDVGENALIVSWTDAARDWLRQSEIADFDDDEAGVRLTRQALTIRGDALRRAS